MSRSTMTRADALQARAARAHEDPYGMTVDAMLARLSTFAVEIIRLNPDLTDAQVAKGARLKLKAEMAKRAEQSAAARKARNGQGDAA